MKTVVLTLVVAVVVMAMPFTGLAIDRGARIIDQLGVEVGVLDDGDIITGALWSENRLAADNEKWAFLLGLEYGEFDPDTEGVRYDVFDLHVGLKYYLTPVTSLSLTGDWSTSDGLVDEIDSFGGTLTAKQRLASSYKAISPYAVVSAELARIDQPRVDATDDDATELVLEFGAGADFMMLDNFGFVFEGLYRIAEDVSGDTEEQDGVLVSLFLKYYFD